MSCIFYFCIVGGLSSELLEAGSLTWTVSMCCFVRCPPSLAGMLHCHLHAYACPSPLSHRAEHMCVGIFANLVVRNYISALHFCIMDMLKEYGHMCVSSFTFSFFHLSTLHAFVVYVISILSCFIVFLFCFAHRLPYIKFLYSDLSILTDLGGNSYKESMFHT